MSVYLASVHARRSKRAPVVSADINRMSKSLFHNLELFHNAEQQASLG
ncbi:MAG: hypothetical protein ACJAZD_003306 [Ilumatobacter sp.]|jgi:hypothetical protein